MKNWYKWGLALSMIALQACSSVTVLRTSELQKVGEDVKQDVGKQMRTQLDSMRLILDSLRAENVRLQKRLVAEVATLNSRLGGETEKLNARQEEILYRLDLLVDASSKPIKRVIVDKRSSSSTGAPTVDSVQKAIDEEVILDPELEKLYNNARADFNRSEYKLAYDGFKTVFEKTKTGELAENSLYWMGLCLQETNQSDKAVVVFQRLLDQFPKGKKACVVLLKMAQIAETAGKKEEQVKHLERLTASPQCRESNEALKAIELLDQIKGSGSPQ